MPSLSLKRTVNAELKKRRYIFYTLVLLSLLYISISLVLGDTGLLSLRKLDARRAGLQAEITAIKRENAALGDSLRTYRGNEFYMEKHAREDFGLSRPDEYIFIYER